MPLLSRLLLRPAARRSYSSFFSSKPGGGRYFNSSKPPKSPVVTTKNNTNPDPKNDAQQDAIVSGNTSSTEGTLRGVADPQSNASGPAAASPSSSSTNSTSDDSASHIPDAYTHSNQPVLHNHLHPMIKSKEFKLHEFFSLHRPLLLLSHPSSILHSVPPGTSLFSALEQQQKEHNKSSFHESVSPDTSIDADAEAARQLTRALTMHKAGATVAWEDTLRRLGLDVNQEPDRVNLQEEWNREWEEVLMDSTKRKRRKKMKKHKLKKRRKATRAERMKLR